MKNKFINKNAFNLPNNTLICLIFSPIIIILILRNKEDKKRFIEKFGIATAKRRDGKLIWFHGSSIGEILSIIPIIKNYEKDKSMPNISYIKYYKCLKVIKNLNLKNSSSILSC